MTQSLFTDADHDLRRCSNCAGRGYISTGFQASIDCGRCKGSGRMPKGSDYAIPWDGERKSCPTCHGLGEVTEWTE